MNRGIRLKSLCFLVALVAIPQLASGQQVTAAITGVITDPSGAPIANASVTATDTQRGTTWTTQTNDAGAYNLPRVPIGTYNVRVESRGFQTALRSAITLDVNQTARVDVQMTVGQVSETVEVTAAAPTLQTDQTLLSTVIDSKINVSLPLATRNYVQLTLLAPGSVNPNPSTLTSPQGPGGSGRPYINGNREQANNFLLDGMDNNQVSDNLVGYAPSVDAIQEFNLITQNAPAEFGNFQGGIINTSIKSGTNQFHGSVFEFFRNDVLNANNWANNYNGSPRARLRWNMFGGTIGGPIRKDKFFFFADYQGQRYNQPGTTSAITIFTAAERQGDFSQLLSVKGIQLYNPFDVDASGNRKPFPNNQIPVTLIDPVAQALFSSPLYPAPVNANLQNNFFNTSNSHIYADQGDIKLDYNATDKDRLFARYSRSFQDNPSLNSFPLYFNGFNFAPIQNGVVNWTRTVSSSLVNELRVGMNYVKVNNGAAYGNAGNIGEQLGIQGVNSPGPGLLALNLSGGVVGNFGNSNTYQLFADTVFQFEDALVITRGRHTLHTGFQFWRSLVNSFYGGNNGLLGFMSFDGRFTAGPNALAVAGSGAGAGEADFFLGLPDSFGRGIGNFGTWGQRSSTISAYLQDDFRVSRTLTLNLGVRYETHTPWVEVKDRQVNFGLFSGAVQFPNQSNIYGNRGLYNNYSAGLSFQPRVGFAWTPEALGNTTVFRGAYTISSYLEGTGTNLRLTMNPPFKTPEFQTNYHDTPLPATRIGQGILPPNTGNPFDNALIRLWDPNVMPAIVQQWNFSIQRQFGKSTTLQAAYVGQHGTHLMVPMPYLQKQLQADGSITPSPYLSGNPQLANISQISGTASNGNQRYDSLQATFQRRFAGGLQYQLAYTYSKCMTDSSGYYGSWGGQTTPTSPYWQNLYDKRSEWGPCYYDVTHVLTGHAVYELPFGRGRKWGNSMNRAAETVLGNWQVSGILSEHGGYPLTISAGDASHTNSRGSRADCIAPPSVFGTRNASTGGYQWFDPASYAAPQPGRFGNCGVGTVRGPGLHSLDLSLQKQFVITESKRIEFRAEAINFTNTPILNSPGTGLGGGLGQITSSQGERNVQFALKFHF